MDQNGSCNLHCKLVSPIHGNRFSAQNHHNYCPPSNVTEDIKMFDIHDYLGNLETQSLEKFERNCAKWMLRGTLMKCGHFPKLYPSLATKSKLILDNSCDI